MATLPQLNQPRSVVMDDGEADRHAARTAQAEMAELQRSLNRSLQSVGQEARHHVLALPAALLPFETCRLYPHAVDRVFRQWSHPALFRSEIQSLFLDDRRSRHGFPKAVLGEMGRVLAHYESLFPLLATRRPPALPTRSNPRV